MIIWSIILTFSFFLFWNWSISSWLLKSWFCWHPYLKCTEKNLLEIGLLASWSALFTIVVLLLASYLDETQERKKLTNQIWIWEWLLIPFFYFYFFVCSKPSAVTVSMNLLNPLDPHSHFDWYWIDYCMLDSYFYYEKSWHSLVVKSKLLGQPLYVHFKVVFLYWKTSARQMTCTSRHQTKPFSK